MSIRNSIAVAVIAGGAVLGLAACNATSYKCSGNECEVSLKGEGADTTLGSDGSPVKLVSAGNGTAKFTVEGQELSCSEGETVNFGTTRITCETIGDSELELKFVL